jgi:raffinose/stachyose/melibiose transport system substrate-binding protein
LKEFSKLGFYGDNYLSNSVENAKEAMAKGKAAMFISESAWRNEVKVDFPDFDTNKLGIFVMPWGDNQAIGVNPASNAYFINKNSKHSAEALKFFEFLAKPENLQKRLDGQPGLSEICWPEVPSKYSKEDQAYIDSLKKGMVMQAGVKYIDSQWMDIGKDLEAMYTGASTPQDVLKTIMNRRTEQAKLQKDPDWNK